MSAESNGPRRGKEKGLLGVSEVVYREPRVPLETRVI